VRRVEDQREEEERRRTRGLLALIVVLLLTLGGFYLIERLRAEGLIEDCLMAGHSNCDALIDDP
jgi:hypothetical protein